jgi:hypothetical protein
VRSFGAVLALLAILVQAVLPLADARWHDAQRAGLGDLAFSQTAPADGTALRADPVPAPVVDQACVLCIALQSDGGTLATPPAPLAVPTRYATIVLAAHDAAARTAPRGRPQQPRAPPAQA